MKIKVYKVTKAFFVFKLMTAFLIAFSCIMMSGAIMLGQMYTGEYIEVMNSINAPLIVIDAGHGGEDVGAVGVNGVYEKDLNLEISFLLGDMLMNEGYQVFYTRTQDKLLYAEDENIKGMRKIYDLKNRATIVNEKKPFLFISIHMNYFTIEKYAGFEVYYRDGDIESQKLAYDVADEVKLSADTDNKRTPKATDELYLLSNTTCPALLLECGFLSNTAECQKLCEKEYQKQLCFSIVCGIIKYESRNEPNTE